MFKILFIFLAFPLIALSQNIYQINRQLDSLKFEKKIYIDSVNDSIKNMDLKIQQLQDRKLSLLVKNGFKIKLEWYAGLYKNPRSFLAEIAELQPGTELTVIGFLSNYLEVIYDGSTGYISKTLLPVDKQSILKISSAEKKKLKADSAYWKRQSNKEFGVDKIKGLNEKFGEYLTNKIVKQEIWTGMSTEIAKEMFGEYDHRINNSEIVWTEEWVYPDIILYFEKGKLTSWDEKIKLNID